jgi:hypothetical protein
MIRVADAWGVNFQFRVFTLEERDMWIHAFFLIGDEFNGLFSCGLRTMRLSSLHEFTESGRLRHFVEYGVDS